MVLTHLTGDMTIEDHVFISIMVATANDNIIRAGYSDHIVGPTLRHGSIVGAGAIFLPGTVVGERATVGADAVLTRDVPAGETWVGTPARPFSRA